MQEICMLRSRWRGLETESRLGLHGHERGNPGHRQDHDLRTTAPALDPTSRHLRATTGTRVVPAYELPGWRCFEPNASENGY